MAPYGDDITEGIPYPLSNPGGAPGYSATGEAYDVAIAGQPFFLAAGDDTPYRRVTAQYRKQQIDQTREPGEQTLTGWWLRSQSSFHLGAGAKFFEPNQDESLRFQFRESKGLDPWTRGQITLLNDTASFYTGSIGTTYVTQILGINDGTNDCLLVSDATALKKITSGGSSTTYTQAGTPSRIFSITTDGKRYFFVNTDHVHRGNISGSTSDTEIYNVGATVTRSTIRYVKQRLICAIGPALYELNPNSGGGSLPAAFYTHPNPDWVWSSIAEGPQAIYVSGYDPTGVSSSVYKITLDVATPNSLGFPTLNVPTVIIDMPENEFINDFDVYLGQYAVLATSKGARVGIADANGDVTYGPLLYQGKPSYGIAFRNSYAYVSTQIDGEAGLARIDLSTTVYSGLLFFPYTWDLVAAGTAVTANQVAFFGTSNQAAFTVGNNIWAESMTTKVPSGYLLSGYVRYNTLENKIFKYVVPRFSTVDGGLRIYSVDAEGMAISIGYYPQGADVEETGIPYPNTPQQYLAFKFVMTRSDTDSTKGPLFTGYQLKVLPSIPRQRLIQYPVFCYDHEMDKFNNAVGYEGAAFDRMSQLENIENVGDTVRVEDFRTGESYLGLIEELDFINKTPTDKRFSGFGGTLLVTIRKI
jgi:hypothetical protein